MPFATQPAPVTLSGELVVLRPLARSDLTGLIDAVRDGRLWETAWYTSVPEPEDLAAEIDRRLGLLDRGEMIPFTTLSTEGQVLGMTSFYDLVPEVPRLHIGYTWNRASAHRSGTNTESKYLLLKHAFETLGVELVGLSTQWPNIQSRAAIERLGAKQEGLLRARSRYRNGALRDTVEYSIIASEWPAVRAGLESRMAQPR